MIFFFQKLISLLWLWAILPYLDQLEARSEWSTKFSSATNIDKTLKENNFLFYGFVRDKADVKYCQCIVHKPLTRVTRTAPLVHVAHIPNGKFARQTLEQISEADTEVYAWMQEVRLLGHLVFLGQWIDCQKPETPIILQPLIFR